MPSLLAFDSLRVRRLRGALLRPISLGCSAVSLILLADGKCRPATERPPSFYFAATLALMSALHYYSVFFAIPLFLMRELVRWRKSGKLDIAIPGGPCHVLLVLAVHYPR